MNTRYRQFRHRARLLLAETLNAVQHGLRGDSAQQSASPEMMPLEQRILMSASPAAAAVMNPDLVAAEMEPPETSAELTEPEAAETNSQTSVSEQSQTDVTSLAEATAQTSLELVVIDPSVDAYEQLIDDLQGQAGRRFEILLLNPREDGIAQISDGLQNLKAVSALHLVSHGDEGEILLGTSVLSQRTMERYAAELLSWQPALTADADLLIYGCDLAADESGIQLTQSLHALLGVDVASSVDETGHVSLSGNWLLEHIDGQIEAAVAFSSEVQDDWRGLLSAPELTDTDEFLVNSTTADIQETSADERGSQQAVALAADGSYVVVWSAINQDGSGWGVYARRFDSSGTALTSEIQVADTTTDNQQWARVASDASGSFVVTWTGSHQDGTPQSVYARQFDAAGSPLGSEFRVHGTSTGIQKNSSVAMSGDGSFIVVWEGAGPGDTDGIHAQRFDAVGATIGPEFTVNLVTGGVQGHAAVAMNSAGQFVVAWDSGAGVVARAFDENGIAQTAEVTIDASASAARPSTAMNSAGEFVVVWNRDTTGLGTGVFVRAYGLTGTPLTTEATVNTSVLGDQRNGSVSMDPAGNYLVTWEGQGPFRSRWCAVSAICQRPCEDRQ